MTTKLIRISNRARMNLCKLAPASTSPGELFSKLCEFNTPRIWRRCSSFGIYWAYVESLWTRYGYMSFVNSSIARFSCQIFMDGIDILGKPINETIEVKKTKKKKKTSEA